MRHFVIVASRVLGLCLAESIIKYLIALIVLDCAPITVVILFIFIAVVKHVIDHPVSLFSSYDLLA